MPENDTICLMIVIAFLAIIVFLQYYATLHRHEMEAIAEMETTEQTRWNEFEFTMSLDPESTVTDIDVMGGGRKR